MKFKCKVCDYTCNENYCGTHLKRVHNLNGKTYYDLYLQKNGEGVCLICSSETSFLTIKKGYRTCCSRKCSAKHKNNLLMKKFGVSNLFQLDHIKEKSKRTIKKRYGVDNISRLPSIKKKKKSTMLKRYGVEFGLQNKEIKQKQEDTMFDKYGVKNAMHNKKLAKKAAINGGGRCSSQHYTTKFGDTITIQGSYEERFVKLCEAKNIRIINGPCLKYEWSNKISKYFVDFKIKQGDNWRLVEVKSSYWNDKYKDQVAAKSEAAKEWSKKMGFLEFSLIIDDIKIPLH
jgi:hypothetical protein